MKRYSAVRIFSAALEKGDVGVFVGKDICKEAFAYDRPGNFYLSRHENMLSLGLGMAMCSDRRVFLFCDDAYFLRNMSEAAHIAISKCDNIYIVVMVNGIYTEVGNHPTIFNSLMSPHGFLFNLGFIVHDYKRHFKNMRNPTKEINAIWQKTRGPLVVLLEVDKGVKKLPEDFPAEKRSIDSIMAFIQNEEIPSYNYVPPVTHEKAFDKEE